MTVSPFVMPFDDSVSFHDAIRLHSLSFHDAHQTAQCLLPSCPFNDKVSFHVAHQTALVSHALVGLHACQYDHG